MVINNKGKYHNNSNILYYEELDKELVEIRIPKKFMHI